MPSKDENKADLRETLSNASETLKGIDAAENFLKESPAKISASPLVQGLIVGYIAAKIPVGRLLAVGTGIMCGLFLEENFQLPDFKEKILSILPEPKSKDEG